MRSLSVKDFLVQAQGQADIRVLDVRTQGEYKRVRLNVPSVNLPLDQVSVDRVSALFPEGSGTLYVICNTQNRSRIAAQRLMEQGMRDLVVVEGGISACDSMGFCQKDGTGMDLERQVRLIAGLMVLAGFLLGSTVSSGFHLLSGFVGLGLVFAGATGWCGLALFLAKAPWNR